MGGGNRVRRPAVDVRSNLRSVHAAHARQTIACILEVRQRGLQMLVSACVAWHIYDPVLCAVRRPTGGTGTASPRTRWRGGYTFPSLSGHSYSTGLALRALRVYGARSEPAHMRPDLICHAPLF
jgi:hypothetical protein